MSDGEIREAFLNLTQYMDTQAHAATTQAQTMTTQENREVAPRVNQNASTMAFHLIDFTRMNPLMFFGSKVNEDPHDFLDEVYNILYAIRVSLNEKAELSAYQLKDVAQILYIQRKENKAFKAGPISSYVFRREFLDRFFSRDKIEAKVEDFINIRQEGMSVQEYSLKFIKLSKYASSLLFNPRDEMSCIVTGVSDVYVVEE